MTRKTVAGELLYRRVAHSVVQQIENGALQVGDKAPSVRSLSRVHSVSIATSLQACLWLEHRGYVEARPRSGFYIRVPFKELIREPSYRSHEPVPTAVGTATIIHEVVQMAADPSMVPFGAAFPGPGALAASLLNKSMKTALRRTPLHSASYDLPEASGAFRREIARHSLSHGCNFSPDDIIATCGALEAINLCLRAVAGPGDVIAIESPTYFGVLQAIQSLGMRAVEIPTHPQGGMCFDALESALRKYRVKACVVMPNCHNPIGYVIPERRKQTFVELTHRYGVPVIEDDVYGDLAFDGREKTLKAWDREGLILLCSSFSKVLAPGLRIGWVHAGKYRNEVEKLKYVTTIAAPTLAQLVVANSMKAGQYDRYLRKLRRTFAEQVQSATNAVARYFPEGTRVTKPRGGYMLWVELPPSVDGFCVYREALLRHISIMPGAIFSPDNRFRNYIRISCNQPWSDRQDEALRVLGDICRQVSQPS